MFFSQVAIFFAKKQTGLKYFVRLAPKETHRTMTCFLFCFVLYEIKFLKRKR